MRLVVLVSLSRTKISELLLVSPGTKLVAVDSKAMKWPSAEIAGLIEKRSPSLPNELIEMRVRIVFNSGEF